MTKLFSRTFATSPEDAKIDHEISEKISLLQTFLKPEHLDIPSVLHNEASWLVCLIRMYDEISSCFSHAICFISTEFLHWLGFEFYWHYSSVALSLQRRNCRKSMLSKLHKRNSQALWIVVGLSTICCSMLQCLSMFQLGQMIFSLSSFILQSRQALLGNNSRCWLSI